MTTFNIELPTTFTVTSRGVTVTVETSRIAHHVATSAFEGFQHTIKDAAASALANAFDAANPDHGLEGDALKAARKAFGDDPANKEAIDAEVANLMESRVNALASGTEWKARGSSVDSDPLDPYRRAVVREAISKDKESDAWRAYAAIPSEDRKARDTFLLDLAAKNAKAVDRVAKARMEADQAAKAAASGLDIGM